MEIIRNTTEFKLNRETAVAIGKFDGVHLGHRKLLQEIIDQRQKGLDACVFTFDPTPAILFGHSDGKELTTREEKRKLFERMGVDILVEFPLTMETAAIAPECFVEDILVKQLKVRLVAAGADLSFGSRGAGDASLLTKLSKKFGFEVRIIDKIMQQEMEVSSTYIRSLVEKGEMEAVEAFQGTAYTIVGTVVHGNRIGRTLGFPTVNLLPPDNKLLPPNGVYRSEVLFHGQKYRAISNVGCKPTVSNEKVMGVETYLYDFQEDIYGKEIEVYLHEFKRPEQRFASLEDLKMQLQKDIKDNMD